MRELIHKTGLVIMESTYQGSSHMVKNQEKNTVFLGSIFQCRDYIIKMEKTRLMCL